METIFLIIAIMSGVGFGVALLAFGWSIYQQQQRQQRQAYEAWLAATRQPEPAAAPEDQPDDDIWEDDVTDESPEPEPEPEPRIWAFVKGKSTYQMTEAEYQAWFERYQQRRAEITRQHAELEQQRAAARAAAEAEAAVEAAAIAQMPVWLVEFAAQYKLRRLDEIELLQSWVALVLQFAHTQHGGQFPVKPVWKGVVAAHGAAAPDSRFTSYVFFRRLSEALIAAGLVTRGRRGQAARLNVDRLPGWAS